MDKNRYNLDVIATRYRRWRDDLGRRPATAPNCGLLHGTRPSKRELFDQLYSACEGLNDVCFIVCWPSKPATLFLTESNGKHPQLWILRHDTRA